MLDDHGSEHLKVVFPPFQSYPPSLLQKLAIGLGGQLPSTYLGQRAAGWIRGLMQATCAHPVDVEVLGMRMRLRLADNSCERRLLVTPHFFEPESVKAFRERLRPGFRFVDVGANVGTYSLIAARGAGPTGKVLAVEPNPGLVQRLLENASLNNCHIIVEEVAAADFNGTLTLRRDGNNLGASTLVPQVKVRSPEPLLDVACAKILDLVQRHGFDRIDAMKLDIEGGEDRAVMAFLNEAPEDLWPKFLLIENNSSVWGWDFEGELRGRGWARIASMENLLLMRG